MRLFISLELPPAVWQQTTKKISTDLANFLITKKITSRFTPPANFHLTVAFLGEVPDSKLSAVKKILTDLAKQTYEINLYFNGWRWLKQNNKQLVGLITAAANPTYSNLQKRITSQLATLNIKSSTKPPHLTLLRLKNPLLTRWPKIKFHLSTRLTALQLIQSRQTDLGARYTVLQRYQLRPEKFRRNIVICLINNQNEILLVRHQDRPNSWQLPQGGVEAEETLSQAAARELKEEVGLTKFKIIATQPDIYRYRWPARLLEHGSDPEKKNYVGQLQSLAIITTATPRPNLKLDKREALAALWVKQSDLLKSLPKVRQNLGRLIIKELAKFNSLSLNQT